MNAFDNRIQYKNLTKEEKEQFTSEAKKAGMYFKQIPDGSWTDASTKFGKFGESTVYRLKKKVGYKYLSEKGTEFEYEGKAFKPTDVEFQKKHSFYIWNDQNIGLVTPLVEPPSPEYIRKKIKFHDSGTPYVEEVGDGKAYITCKPIGWIIQGWEFKGYSFDHLDKKDIRSKMVISSRGETTYIASHAVFRKISAQEMSNV